MADTELVVASGCSRIMTDSSIYLNVSPFEVFLHSQGRSVCLVRGLQRSSGHLRLPHFTTVTRYHYYHLSIICITSKVSHLWVFKTKRITHMLSHPITPNAVAMLRHAMPCHAARQDNALPSPSRNTQAVLSSDFVTSHFSFSSLFTPHSCPVFPE